MIRKQLEPSSQCKKRANASAPQNTVIVATRWGSDAVRSGALAGSHGTVYLAIHVVEEPQACAT